MAEVRLLATGLGWPEGPAVKPDGSITFVQSDRGAVSVWRRQDNGGGVGVLETYAFTGGRPNASVTGADGLTYVCQTGPAPPHLGLPNTRSGIQRIAADGSVELVVGAVDGRDTNKPNDLAFGPDGRLYFTDPGMWDPVKRPDVGRLCVVERDGTASILFEVGRSYPNGIAFDAEGRLLWSESYTRLVKRLEPDQSITTVCEFEDPAHVPDGMAFAADGTLYVAATAAQGLQMVGPDGSMTLLAAGALPTNCVFVGQQLYVTDGGSVREVEELQFVGTFWSIDVGVEGLPLHFGAID